MSYNRIKILLRMEWMKTCSRLNIVFTLVVFMLVLLQVAFMVRLDIGELTDHIPAVAANEYAGRYTSNIAFTFIPILLLVNAGNEFDNAVVQRSLVSGWNRRDYYIGKLLQLGIFSSLSLLLAIIFTMLTAVIYENQVVWDFRKLAMYFVVSICLGSLALMMVMMLKKRFYALTCFILYLLLENIFTGIMDKSILLPSQTCIQLLKQGIYEWPQFTMAAAYTVICLVAGYIAFKRSDLR